MGRISDNLQAVRDALATSAQEAGRIPGDVRLLAVSKTFDAEAVREAYGAGQRLFGENYAQEAVDKIAQLTPSCPDIEWHFIGPLQSNKTRLVAEHLDWVQSVDRLKIAQRLSEQRPEAKAPLQVCIQVNIDGGPTKSGVAPEELPSLAAAVAQLPRLALRGIMVIPDIAPDSVAQKALFFRAKAMFDDLKHQHPSCDTLSMGMSADMKLAIEAGSTLVRVGSAIFGQRTGAGQ
jgi:PLP dependent protein